MADERRKERREILFFYTRVFNMKNNALIGHLGDLTPEGAMVISPITVPLNQNYQLRIELPIGEFNQNYLEVEAASRWCEPDIDPANFNVGFKFTKVSDENVVIIDEIVEAHAIRKRNTK